MIEMSQVLLLARAVLHNILGHVIALAFTTQYDLVLVQKAGS